MYLFHSLISNLILTTLTSPALYPKTTQSNHCLLFPPSKRHLNFSFAQLSHAILSILFFTSPNHTSLQPSLSIIIGTLFISPFSLSLPYLSLFPSMQAFSSVHVSQTVFSIIFIPSLPPFSYSPAHIPPFSSPSSIYLNYNTRNSLHYVSQTYFSLCCFSSYPPSFIKLHKSLQFLIPSVITTPSLPPDPIS